jgi:hypothetical protein
MGSIRIVVKPTAGGDKLHTTIEPSASVLDVKGAIAEQAGIPATEQRLIYKGQILKDERTVESYGACLQAARCLRCALEPARAPPRPAAARASTRHPAAAHCVCTQASTTTTCCIWCAAGPRATTQGALQQWRGAPRRMAWMRTRTRVTLHYVAHLWLTIHRCSSDAGGGVACALHTPAARLGAPAHQPLQQHPRLAAQQPTRAAPQQEGPSA